MSAPLATILDRAEAFPADVRHLEQFTLGPAEQVATDIVLAPNWSFYCLDIAGDQAVFVELPSRVNLAEAPFAYAAQFAHAQRVALVPLDALPTLAAQVPAPRNLVLLMSTGRCGSTLASRIFAQIDGVWSLSEPEWFTNLAFARFDLDEQRLQTLIAACARLTCRPPEGTDPHTIVLKPRSEMMIQAPSYFAALPDARAVFLYRDCVGYVNSLYRFAQRLQGVKDPKRGSPDWSVIYYLSTINAPEAALDRYFAADEEVGAIELMALGWAVRMQAYMDAAAGGMRMAPLHYTDLTQDRTAQTRMLLQNCGIPEQHLAAAMHGFDKDAHAGSAGENAIAAHPLTEPQKARVRELVARWGMSDYQTTRLAAL